MYTGRAPVINAAFSLSKTAHSAEFRTRTEETEKKRETRASRNYTARSIRRRLSFALCASTPLSSFEIKRRQTILSLIAREKGRRRRCSLSCARIEDSVIERESQTARPLRADDTLRGIQLPRGEEEACVIGPEFLLTLSAGLYRAMSDRLQRHTRFSLIKPIKPGFSDKRAWHCYRAGGEHLFLSPVQGFRLEWIKGVGSSPRRVILQSEGGHAAVAGVTVGSWAGRMTMIVNAELRINTGGDFRALCVVGACFR